MIDKVLIAEDHQSINISVEKTLETLRIDDAMYVSYCDEALKQIIIAQKNGVPYDLLITDLSFDEDDNPQAIKDGWQLITAVRKIQPAIKVLVFSIKKDLTTAETLYKKYAVDAFVPKGRHDTAELCTAINCLNDNRPYFPRHLSKPINEKNAYNFQEVDIEIISLLARGVALKDIPARLQQKKLHPASLSSVEKRLKSIRDVFGYNKNEELVIFCKVMNMI